MQTDLPFALLLGLACGLSAACSSSDSPQPVAFGGGCTADTECKGDRICQAGQCVSPSAGGAGGAAGQGSSGQAGSSAGKGGTAGSGQGGAGGSAQAGSSGKGGSLQGGSGGSSQAGSGGSGQGGSAQGPSATAKIGPEGGTVSLMGAKLTIPAGALAQPLDITIELTSEAPPSTYKAFSPVYRFSPEGTTFSKPVSISLPFTGDEKLAALFWSKPQGAATTGWDFVGGVATGASITAAVAHFSKGFVADGVNYQDPPDLSCVRSRKLDAPQHPENSGAGGAGPDANPGAYYGPHGGLAVFFQVEDCWGRPVTGLTDADFLVKIDGQKPSSEEPAQVSPKAGVTLFASLVLDMSSSTQAALPQLIAGAQAFVDTVLPDDNSLKTQVSIELFDGSQDVVEWQKATVDKATLKDKLAQLAQYTPPSPNGTNLHGAVLDSLSRLNAARDEFSGRNHDGALSSGYLVLFTDGKDTASAATVEQVQGALAASDVGLLAAALAGPDYDAAGLLSLTPNVTSADNPAALQNTLAHLGYRMKGEATRTYQLSFCNASIAGDHTLTAEVQKPGTTNKEVATHAFSAYPSSGCSLDSFAHACDGRSCGGLACGACDDRSAGCDGATGKCVSYCQGTCGETTITNPVGYAQLCPAAPNATLCDGVCVDLRQDTKNCGACGTVCADTETCFDQKCRLVEPVTSVGSPKQLALDAGNIYELGNQSLVRIPKPNGAPQSLLDVALFSSFYVFAIDATDAYVVASDPNSAGWLIYRVALDGSQVTTLAKSDKLLDSIAVTDAYVYVTSKGGVEGYPKAGGAPFSQTFGCDLLSPGQVVANGQSAVWLAENVGCLAPGLNGRDDAGEDLIVASGGLSPQAFALDEGHLAWSEGNGDIKVCSPLSKCLTPVGTLPQGNVQFPVTTIATNQSGVKYLTLDGTHAYWAFSNDLGVWRAPLDGSAPPELIDAKARPKPVYVDATHVYYWIWQGGEELVRVAR